MTLLSYTGANASSFCATENSQPVHYQMVVVAGEESLTAAELFYSLAA